MNRFASLLASAAVLSTLTVAAHAADLNPIDLNYGLMVGSTTLTSANTGFDGLNLTFNDGTSTFTFVDLNAAPLLSALAINRTCATLNFGGCAAETVTASNASALGGLVQAGLFVGTSLSASAQGNISVVNFNQVANLGGESAVVGVPGVPATNSPVPEPGTLGLMATGLVGAAGAVRRRLRA